MSNRSRPKHGDTRESRSPKGKTRSGTGDGKGYRIAFWIFLVISLSSFAFMIYFFFNYLGLMFDPPETGENLAGWFFGDIITSGTVSLYFSVVFLVAGVALLVVALVLRYLGNHNRNEKTKR